MLSLCAKFYAKLRMKIHEALFIMEAFDVVKNIILFPKRFSILFILSHVAYFYFEIRKGLP